MFMSETTRIRGQKSGEIERQCSTRCGIVDITFWIWMGIEQMMIAASNLCASHCFELGESDSIKNYIFRDIIRSVIVNTVFEKNMRHFLFFPESRYIFEKMIFGKVFTNCIPLEMSTKYSKFLLFQPGNKMFPDKYRDIFLKNYFGKMFTSCTPLEISTKYSKFLHSHPANKILFENIKIHFWNFFFGKMFTNCILLEISTKYSK